MKTFVLSSVAVLLFSVGVRAELSLAPTNKPISTAKSYTFRAIPLAGGPPSPLLSITNLTTAPYFNNKGVIPGGATANFDFPVTGPAANYFKAKAGDKKRYTIDIEVSRGGTVIEKVRLHKAMVVASSHGNVEIAFSHGTRTIIPPKVKAVAAKRGGQ